MMDSFSWSDSIHATLGTCLPCIKPAGDASDDDEPQRRRHNTTSGRTTGHQQGLTAREELERLLDQPVSSDEDVETMSLHSNVGQSRRAKTNAKKRRAVKTVRLFGVELFGRRGVASTSANHDEEEEERRAAKRRSKRPRTISTSTLDSDAAPLGDEQITDFTSRANQRWAPTQTDEELAIEERRERERMEKERRREERKERKALKKLGQQTAFVGEEEEFEGFPGSGSSVVAARRRSSSVASPALATDEFGPFVTGSQAVTHQRKASEDDHEEEEADFDAAAYTKKSRTGGEGSQSGSGSHSRSRSRTSASLSADGSTSRPKPGRSAQPSPLGQDFNGASSPNSTSGAPRKKKEKKDHTRAKPSKSSSGFSTATPSLPSPTSSPAPDVKIHSHDFDGVPGGLATPRDHLNAFTQSSPAFPSTGFPSAGFGGFKRTTSGLSGSAGVALARRGDN